MTYTYDGYKHNNLKIPVVEMSNEDVKNIHSAIKSGDNVTVFIEPSKTIEKNINNTDSNPFAESNSLKVWIPFSVVFMLWDVVLLALTIYRLQGFIYYFKLEASVPQGCLFLQIATSISKILFWWF